MHRAMTGGKHNDLWHETLQPPLSPCLVKAIPALSCNSFSRQNLYRFFLEIVSENAPVAFIGMGSLCR